MKKGQLTFGVRIGRIWRFPIKEARKWVAENMERVCPSKITPVKAADYEDLEIFKLDFFDDRAKDNPQE